MTEITSGSVRIFTSPEAADAYAQGYRDGTAAEQQRIRQLVLEQAAIYPDDGWSAIARATLEDFADLLDTP